RERVRSRSGSSPSRRSAHVSRSSIATSTDTATAGKACEPAWRVTRAGRSASPATRNRLQLAVELRAPRAEKAGPAVEFGEGLEVSVEYRDTGPSVGLGCVPFAEQEISHALEVVDCE